MPQDTNLIMMASALKDADGSETGVDFGGPDVNEHTYRLLVTDKAGTNPTLDVTIEENGYLVDDTELTLLAAAEYDADDNGASVDFGTEPPKGQLLHLAVTAKSGTDPTLDVTVEESDNDTDWTEIGAFPQLVDAGDEYLQIETHARYLRVVYDIGGTDTPTFTFGVTMTGWNTLGSFKRLVAAGEEFLSIRSNARFRRAAYVIGGTDSPSFTFQVDVTAAGRYNKW